MSYIFCSYSHDDIDFVELARVQLLQHELSAWVDIHGIRAGVDWRKEIDTVISGAKCVLVIISPASMKSHYVTYEWAFACGARIPVLPILYKKAVVHSHLKALQYIDFSHKASRPWLSLIERLKSI